jgi:hypothetical protein
MPELSHTFLCGEEAPFRWKVAGFALSPFWQEYSESEDVRTDRNSGVERLERGERRGEER